MSRVGIDAYLAELERHLRARLIRRARLLREVEAHLCDLAAEFVAAGTKPDEAEATAVRRFGAAAAVATRFAEAAASTTAHRATVAAGGALIAYVGAFCAFATSASPLVRDFPQGAPSFFGIQFAAVALGIALVRSLRWRPELAAPPAELSSLAHAVLLASGALVASALAEAVIALTRPAGVVVWDTDPWLTIAFGAATIIMVISALQTGRATAQATAISAFSRASALSSEVLLIEDMHVIGERLPFARMWLGAARLLKHPWRVTLLLAGSAFAAITGTQAASGGVQHASRFAGAVVLGVVEVAAVIVGFVAFSRRLGLRASKPARME